MTRRRYVKFILILGSLTALTPFSIDMYLPGFPAIAANLRTDLGHVQLTLSAFFIGVAAGQLLYGPLLDRFGRKRPLYFGLTLYVLSSLFCAFATSIDSLIVLRLVQALGACAASVAAVAMVRDIFPVEDNAKVFALLMLVVGASPMIAPTIGGYVTATAGWHIVFVILAVMGAVICAAVVIGLPESRAPDRAFSLKPAFIVGNFIDVLRNPVFYINTACGAIALAGLLTYVAGSPVMFMEVFGVGQKMYGWIFALLSVGFIGSSNLNSLMLKKYSSERLISSALFAQTLVSLVLLMGTYFHWLGLYATIVLIFLFLCCVGFVLPNSSALAMSPFADNAGSASSLMGATQMGLGALTTIVLSAFNAHSAVPVTAVMAATAVAALTVSALRSRTVLQL